jgi:uncharacterized membrane protein
MKLHIFTSTFLLILVISACKEPQQKTKTVFVTDTTKVADTVVFIREPRPDESFPDSAPSGMYFGMLPCNGCDGIQQIILFDSGRSFRQEELLWGKQTRPLKRTGTWTRSSDLLLLNSGGRTIAKLQQSGDTLTIVELNNISTNKSDLERYRLTKATRASENPAWSKKKVQGLDFLGIGNEPFWALEIDNEKHIYFKLADWKKPVIVPIEPPRKSPDSTTYSVKAEGAPLNITIYPEFGSDGMSDFLYDYKVVVQYLGQVYTGRGIDLKNMK